eukprot:TRINITY_DN12095_c0_g1_i1.p1 TRINITY_DN12095_c0_g1~~TRINITY_DN12095_c0_g1_i1.p1  ORF type:complete len:211 (+),score=49.75 TRINITY_DN12095_c0_g1_i1:70-633(+)
MKDYDLVKKNRPIPRFLGYICEHSYAGELRGDKLKGKDAALWAQLSPHFPGSRVAHIDVRVHGPAGGDEGAFIRKPTDLDGIVVEIDEVDASAPAETIEKSFFGGWGDYSFTKANKPSRPLFVGLYGVCWKTTTTTPNQNYNSRCGSSTKRNEWIFARVKLKQVKGVSEVLATKEPRERSCTSAALS